MSVREYSLNFTKLLKIFPYKVSNPRERMSTFILGVFELVVKELYDHDH